MIARLGTVGRLGQGGVYGYHRILLLLLLSLVIILFLSTTAKAEVEEAQKAARKIRSYPFCLQLCFGAASYRLGKTGWVHASCPSELVTRART